MKSTLEINKFLYHKDNVSVRATTHDDVYKLSYWLRKSDLDEIWASHMMGGYEALLKSLNYSDICLTGFIDDDPIVMFGVREGMVWLLASDRIDEVKIKFIKYSHFFIQELLKDHEVLYNYVHAKNTKSISWLKSLGAEMSAPTLYGICGELFRYFEFKRRG